MGVLDAYILESSNLNVLPLFATSKLYYLEPVSRLFCE
jgi:hypothetical protein